MIFHDQERAIGEKNHNFVNPNFNFFKFWTDWFYPFMISCFSVLALLRTYVFTLSHFRFLKQFFDTDNCATFLMRPTVPPRRGPIAHLRQKWWKFFFFHQLSWGAGNTSGYSMQLCFGVRIGRCWGVWLVACSGGQGWYWGFVHSFDYEEFAKLHIYFFILLY